MPFAATWVDLEIITLSEVGQRQISHYLYVQSKKVIQMKLFIKQNRLTDIENKLMVTKRGKRQEEVNEEFGINIDKYYI